MATLTPQQIAQFRRDGTLIIEGLVPPAVTEGWRAQFWEAVDADPHDTGTWPGRFEETVLTIHAHSILQNRGQSRTNRFGIAPPPP